MYLLAQENIAIIPICYTQADLLLESAVCNWSLVILLYQKNKIVINA